VDPPVELDWYFAGGFKVGYFVAMSPTQDLAVTSMILFDEEVHVYDISGNSLNILHLENAGPDPETDTPRRVTMSDDGSIMISADYVSDGISKIDPTTGMTLDAVETGDRNYFAQVSPDGTRAFSCDYETHTVSYVDTSDMSVIGTEGTLPRPANCSFSPDMTRAYATTLGQSYDGMGVFDISSGFTKLADITLGNIGWFGAGGGWVPNPAVSPDGLTVAVAISHDDFNGEPVSVAVIDTNLMALQTKVDCSHAGGRPYFTAISPTDNICLATDGIGNTVHIIQLAGLGSTHIGDISLNPGSNPHKAIYQDDGAYVYINNLDANNINVVETTGYTVVHTVTLPGSPTDMVKTGNELYISCELESGVYDYPSINIVSMQGTSSALLATYDSDYYGSSIAAHGASGIAMTTCHGWDTFSWLHDPAAVTPTPANTPTPAPIPTTGSFGIGFLIIAASILLLVFTRRIG